MNLKLKAVEVEKELTNKRLKVIRSEKEQKEKEAADHLEEIEQKASRVDELEKQHVLLNMDKDKLKKENAGLIKQLMESGNKANIEFVKAGDKVNMFFEEKRNLNKYNRMSS